MLRVCILKCLSKTPIVTSIENNATNLVRQTYWYAKSKALNTVDICANAISAYLLSNVKAWLNTGLDSQTASNIEVGQNRDINVVKLISKTI